MSSSPTLLNSNEYERYLQNEWAPGADDMLLQYRGPLSRWYANAIEMGYNPSASLLLSIVLSLRGSSPKVPEYEWDDQSKGIYRTFLEDIRKSSTAYTCQQILELHKETIFAKEAAQEEDILWNALLQILRDSHLVFPTRPLYSQEWLCQRLQNIEISKPCVSASDIFFKEIAARIKKDLTSDLGHLEYPHPYFFAFQGKSLTEKKGESSEIIEQARRLYLFGKTESSWGNHKKCSYGFNETVAAKYFRDHRLDGDEEIYRRKRSIKIRQEGTETRPFCQSYKVVDRQGSVLFPPELANDWDLLLVKLANNEALYLTDYRPAQAQTYLKIHLQVFISLEDEIERSWEGITRSDHLHALALLILHDLVFYLAHIEKLHLDFDLSLIQTDDSDHHAHICTFKSSFREIINSMPKGNDEVIFDREKAFLMQSSIIAPWFKAFESTPFEVTMNVQEDKMGRYDLDIFLCGEGQPIKKEGVRPNTLKLSIGLHKPTFASFQPQGSWKFLEPQGKFREYHHAYQTPLWLEKHWRVEIVLALLGHIIN